MYIEAALAEAKCTFADVVRVRYLLPDREDFEPCPPPQPPRIDHHMIHGRIMANLTKTTQRETVTAWGCRTLHDWYPAPRR